MADEPKSWFPAKRYGWGWSFPQRWQGWAVVAGYVAFIGAGALVISPSRQPGLFIGYLVLVTAVLIAICWTKGEPPRWRWGKRS